MAKILSQSPGHSTFTSALELPNPGLLADPDLEPEIQSTHLKPSDTDMQNHNRKHSETVEEVDVIAGAQDSPDATTSPPSRRDGQSSRLSPSELPAFSFNPGVPNVETVSNASSRPHSPTKENMPPSPKRGHHHRRRTSEYIGAASPGTIANASHPPSEADSSASLENPSLKGRGWGHRHRRSAAISSSDLSSPQARQTATELACASSDPVPPYRPGKASLSLPGHSAGASVETSTDSSPRSPTFPSPTRVNFSENVEIIPETQQEDDQSVELTKGSPHRSKSVEELPRKSAMAANPRFSHDDQTTVTSPRPQSAGASRGSKDPDDLQRQSFRDDMFGEKSVGSGPGLAEVKAPNSSHTDVMSVSHRHIDLVSAEMREPLRPPDPDVLEASESPKDESTMREGGTLGSSPGLNMNFDEDPTSSSLSGLQHAKSLPTLRSLKATSRVQHETDAEHNAIDISAEGISTPSQEELRRIRKKGFSAARQSMHSSGLGGSGTLGVPSPYHRRSESAPSLAPPSQDGFELCHQDSASASGKGFEMSNVFEEDEDDGPATETLHPIENVPPSNASRLGRPVTEPSLLEDGKLHLANPTGYESDNSAANPTPSISDEATGGLASTDDPSADAESSRSSESTVKTRLDQKQAEQAGHLFEYTEDRTPERPNLSTADAQNFPTERTGGPIRPIVPSIRTWSHSLTDSRRLNIPQIPTDRRTDSRSSADGVPSLVSSASTLASPAQKNTPDTASPTYPLAPGSAGSSSTRSSHFGMHQKRSSIVSLSKLLRPSTPQPSSLSIEQRAQSPTSDHNGTKKEKKSGRLTRALHFFKSRSPDKQDTV